MDDAQGTNSREMQSLEMEVRGASRHPSGSPHALDFSGCEGPSSDAPEKDDWVPVAVAERSPEEAAGRSTSECMSRGACMSGDVSLWKRHVCPVLSSAVERCESAGIDAGDCVVETAGISARPLVRGLGSPNEVATHRYEFTLASSIKRESTGVHRNDAVRALCVSEHVNLDDECIFGSSQTWRLGSKGERLDIHSHSCADARRTDRHRAIRLSVGRGSSSVLTNTKQKHPQALALTTTLPTW